MPKKSPQFSFSKRLPLPSFLFLIVGFIAGYLTCESEKPVLFNAPSSQKEIKVCFSPEGQCEKAILTAINSARHQIDLQIYAFTSRPIAIALKEARARGVKIQILCDASQLETPHSQILSLKKLGIPVRKDAVEGLAHNKTLLIDHHLLVTGSYNFTKAANQRNAENILFIENPALVSIYRKNFIYRYAKALP